MITRRRLLIARAGLVAAVLAAVWLLIDARSDAAGARRQLAEQSDPTAPGSLAYRLADAESARGELVAELETAGGQLEALRRSVAGLPAKFPKLPTPAATGSPASVVTVTPGAGGTVILRPVQPAPAARPASTPRPTSSSAPTSSPSPSATPSPPCLVSLLGVGVCPDDVVR